MTKKVCVCFVHFIFLLSYACWNKYSSERLFLVVNYEHISFSAKIALFVYSIESNSFDDIHDTDKCIKMGKCATQSHYHSKRSVTVITKKITFIRK